MNSILKTVSKNEYFLPKDITKNIDNYLPKFIKCEDCNNSKKYLSNKMTLCSYCKNCYLCKKCSCKANYFSKYYRHDNKFMCDNCCWWE